MTKVLHHLFKVGESLAVDGKRAVLLLVIDVEVDNVRGNLAFAELTGNFPHPRFGIITVSALLISQRGERRHGRASGKRCEITDHALRIGAVKEVVVQFAGLSAERVGIPRFLAEVKTAAVGVVEKNTVRRSVAHSEKEG